MKLNILFIVFLLLLSESGIAQGWRKYRKVLKREFNGLTPFSIPDNNYSPGTVLLVYKRNEHLFETQKNAFPDLQPVISNVPTLKIEKVKKIEFDFNIEPQIIPGEISAIASLGLDSESKYYLDMKSVQRHHIPLLELKTLIHSLDMNKIKERLLLEELLKDECVVIAQGLLIDGMTFTFKRKRKYNPTIKSKIEQAASDAGLDLKIINNYKFSITTDAALYYAYDIYAKDMDELRRLYRDKMSILQLQAEAMELRTKNGMGLVGNPAIEQEIQRIAIEIDEMASRQYEIFNSGSGWNQLENMYGYDPIPDSED